MTENSNKQILSSFPLGLHWKTQDPFLFCAFHNDHFPKGNGNLGPSKGLENRVLGSDFQLKDGYRMYHGSEVPGFPAHPHSGFETVTIVNQGFVDHADSLGNGGRYGFGECQWMTAGRGILHSEMFPLVYTDQENILELLQIWLNLPESSKGAAPDYKVFNQSNVKEASLDSDRVKIRLYSGAIEDINAEAPPKDSWASKKENDVCIWTIEIKSGGTLKLPKAKNQRSLTSLYFYEGQNISINNQSFNKMTGFELNSNSETEIVNSGDETAKFLFLRGAPINEPVVQHGPFVSTSKEGLVETIEIFNKNLFGGWPWKSEETTHGEKAESFEVKAKTN